METEIAPQPAPTSWPQNLVLDIALGILSSKELCTIYEISEDQFLRWKSHPLFQKQVLTMREELKTSGQTFLAKAKVQAEALLTEAYLIATDRTLPAAVRSAQIRDIMRWARFDQPPAPTVAVEASVKPVVNLVIQSPVAVESQRSTIDVTPEKPEKLN